MMELVAILVFLCCAVVFLWAICRQFVGISEQFRVLRRVEDVILLICDDPKHLHVLKKVDDTNDEISQSILELVEKAEKHQKNLQLSEKKKVAAVIREEHATVEKLAKQLRATKSRIA